MCVRKNIQRALRKPQADRAGRRGTSAEQPVQTGKTEDLRKNRLRVNTDQPEALAAEGVRKSKGSDGRLPFAKQTFICRLP
jgi:hypothetical protein